LPVRVLSKLFRRLMLARLDALHAAGRLRFAGRLAGLNDGRAFAAHLAPARGKDWFVHAKRPFAGPKAVLAYLARYTPTAWRSRTAASSPSIPRTSPSASRTAAAPAPSAIAP
jgi:hypothetical protein